MRPEPARAGSRALVLAAHGSRRDPAANALVRRYAEEIRRRRLFDEVAVAFHQGEPGFDTVLDELSADEVTVVPFMTSAGHYSETVLPAALARNRRYSEIRLRQTPPLGTHPGIAALVARRVTQLLRNEGLTRDAVSLVLVGHGTTRHPGSRTATLHLGETLELRRVAGQVLAGFIDDDPLVEQVLDRARPAVALVVPFLIGGGTHALSDLPQALGISDQSAPGTSESGSRVILDEAVGSYSGLVELVIDLARRHPPPPPRLRRRGGRQSAKTPGSVYLVGAGPGDPGLITARGLELLRRADLVVHDRLIGPELLLEASAGAELVDVGKGQGHAPLSQEAINQLLVEAAREGRMVVRLKGGDPFVFGRGSEELAACRESGILCEVVPGVSSAIAGPAAAGIPVTARGVAHSFAVITGHRASPDGGDTAELRAFASVDTLVLLMGRERLAGITEQLILAGRDPATPAACIQSATMAEQRVTLATLGTIAEAADRDGLEAPVVTVIGAVAALAESRPAQPLRLESLVLGLGA
jgi:uroporphyrin-III C-methyltransferase